MSKVIMDNRGFYCYLRCFSVVEENSTNPRIGVISPSLLLNHLNHNQVNPNTYYS